MTDTPQNPARLHLLPDGERAAWVVYPRAFLRIVEQGLIDLTPWHILEASQAVVSFEGLARRYPSRDLFPFAYRQDNDDIACWSKDSGETVFIIHDFASPGWENSGVFDDVWSWFRDAVEESIDWE